ncbi:uncharacterized protein [Panulirus ornatus]|uniref:uncharacterized protein isoform X2 n=1 Tax=Panulirus ornatus TaxID=150431 RepID=UPI003A861435
MRDRRSARASLPLPLLLLLLLLLLKTLVSAQDDDSGGDHGGHHPNSPIVNHDRRRRETRANFGLTSKALEEQDPDEDSPLVKGVHRTPMSRHLLGNDLPQQGPNVTLPKDSSRELHHSDPEVWTIYPESHFQDCSAKGSRIFSFQRWVTKN